MHGLYSRIRFFNSSGFSLLVLVSGFKHRFDRSCYLRNGGLLNGQGREEQVMSQIHAVATMRLEFNNTPLHLQR